MPIVMLLVDPVTDPDFTLPVYAVVGDLRARGVENPPDDETVERAIRYASRIVDGYVGHGFGGSTATSIVVDDIRGDEVPFPFLAAGVTSVAVNGRTLSETSYAVRPWGILLSSSYSYGIRGRGASFVIEGDFTQAIPDLVNEATILLTLDRLGLGTGGSIIPVDLPKGLRSFSVEGLSIGFGGDSNGGTVSTTGNRKADDLLDLLGGSNGGIA